MFCLFGLLFVCLLCIDCAWFGMFVVIAVIGFGCWVCLDAGGRVCVVSDCVFCGFSVGALIVLVLNCACDTVAYVG